MNDLSNTTIEIKRMLVALDQKIDRRFEALEGRIEARFSGVESRFTGVEGRFTGVENRFNHWFLSILGLQVMTLLAIIAGLFGIVTKLI